MATEKMYELALQFKGIKLWQLLYDDEVFAVRLSDGEIGYCSVMGMLGDHFALGLYVGDEGYQSYRPLLDADYETMDDVKMGVLMTSQNCLQCSFENKEMLSDEELEEVRQYAKTHEKSVKGRNAYPQFTKYRPGRFPWRYDSRLDEQRICDALSAAIALKKILRQYSKKELKLYSLHEDVQKIPMLALEGGRWIVKYTRLPSSSISYPEPEFSNEVLAMRIKQKKKKGTWECGTMRLPTAVQEENHEEQAPCYPLVLICVDLRTEMVQQPIVSEDEDAAEMMKSFAEQLLELDSIPKTVCCGDDRSFALLKDLCTKTGIQIERTDQLQALDEVMQNLLENMGESEEGEPDYEQLEAMFDMLMQMRDSELKQMPQEMADMLYSLAEAGELPETLAKRIQKLFHRK